MDPVADRSSTSASSSRSSVSWIHRWWATTSSVSSSTASATAWPRNSPRNAYRTADGEYVAISAGSQRTFSRLAHAIGQPALTADPRFSTNEARCANADVLDDIVAKWFEARSSQRRHAEHSRQRTSSPVPVYDIKRIFNDPHYADREAIVGVPDPDLGEMHMQGVIPKFSRTPGAIRHTGGVNR